MSQIATFYTTNSKEDDLLEAAKIQKIVVEKKVLFFKKSVTEEVDNFWPFLENNCKEQDEFRFSGSMFCDLNIIFKDKGCNASTIGKNELAKTITKLRETDISIYTFNTAEKALESMQQINLTTEDISSYCRKTYPGEESGTIEALSAALKIFQTWLESIKKDEIGILIVG